MVWFYSDPILESPGKHQGRERFCTVGSEQAEVHTSTSLGPYLLSNVILVLAPPKRQEFLKEPEKTKTKQKNPHRIKTEGSW